MESLYVTFSVQVRDGQYSYQGTSADAEVTVQLPRNMIHSIDPGNLFLGAMEAALENFDAKVDADAGEEDG